MTPLNEFGSTSTTTTTITSLSSSVAPGGGGESWTPSNPLGNGTIPTVVQYHPSPDWTIPLLIIAVLVMVLGVIAVFRHRSKK